MLGETSYKHCRVLDWLPWFECYRTAKTLSAKKTGICEHPLQSQGLRCQKFGNNLNIIKFCFSGKESCRDDFESSQFLYIAQDLSFKLPQHFCSFCFCGSVFLSSWEEPWMRSKQLNWTPTETCVPCSWGSHFCLASARKASQSNQLTFPSTCQAPCLLPQTNELPPSLQSVPWFVAGACFILLQPTWPTPFFFPT